MICRGRGIPAVDRARIAPIRCKIDGGRRSAPACVRVNACRSASPSRNPRRPEARVNSALSGLRVLDLGRFISAPFWDDSHTGMGAEVVRVEPGWNEDGGSAWSGARRNFTYQPRPKQEGRLDWPPQGREVVADPDRAGRRIPPQLQPRPRRPRSENYERAFHQAQHWHRDLVLWLPWPPHIERGSIGARRPVRGGGAQRIRQGRPFGPACLGRLHSTGMARAGHRAGAATPGCDRRRAIRRLFAVASGRQCIAPIIAEAVVTGQSQPRLGTARRISDRAIS